MSKAEIIGIVQTDLLEHPALQAWHELQPVHDEPERIEILKGKLPKGTQRTEKFVCRLVGVGQAGSSVIGKRCRCHKAVMESMIYEEILPTIPIRSLHCYGIVEDTSGESCWLFLEDAGEGEYSKLNGEHRQLTAQWLGLMHTYAARAAAPAFLPSKGPNQYLERLQTARDGILENLANLTLQADQLAPLETTLRQFDVLESHWDQVEAFCAGIPRTLVHGDFATKNVRVRNGPSGTTLLPFDWGEAGWGMPATDIRHVDVTDYWLMVRGHWPWLDVHAIQRLAMAGKIFRCLDAVYWELPNFKFEWWKQRYYNLSIYVSRLADAIRAAGLSNATGSTE